MAKEENEREVIGRTPDEAKLRALMASYQGGDLAAFEELYAQLAPAVRRFLRRFTPDPDRIGDLSQETFLQVHRARHTYDPAYPPLPWVLAIARHVWLMHRRAASRRPQPNLDVEAIALTTRAEADAYPEKATVQAALAAMSPDRRRPVIWHHVWGLSFREIAARLGIRADAAKLRSSRGMAELRTRLHPAGQPPERDENA